MCSIEMDVKTGDQGAVSLFPDVMTLKQSKDMTQFSITECVLINATEPNTGIQMKIKMKRKIMSEMMTTYFPSLLLMMITYATTFFKPFFFEAALSVNLTTMLVMTTIFISKMESLPQTSYMKMIDIWLILCQLAPFAQVVIVTSMEYFRKDDYDGHQMRMVSENKRNSRLDSASRRWEKVIARRRNRENTILSPSSLCIFWVGKPFSKT